MLCYVCRRCQRCIALNALNTVQKIKAMSKTSKIDQIHLRAVMLCYICRRCRRCIALNALNTVQKIKAMSKIYLRHLRHALTYIEFDGMVGKLSVSAFQNFFWIENPLSIKKVMSQNVCVCSFAIFDVSDIHSITALRCI